MTPIRTVLDANIIISGTIAPLGTSAAILDAWLAEYLEIVTCPALLNEIAEKLRLPRIRKRYPISDTDVLNLLLRFGQSAQLVPGVAPVNPPPPDPDDTMLFSAAIESAADYIITGDRALLEFPWTGPGKVVSPRQFWEQEFPRQLALALSYPVIALEDLSARRFYTIDWEGRTCVALFTTRQLAEFFCQSSSLLATLVPLEDRGKLTDYLKRVSSMGCEWVAFNPVRQYCILQPIGITLETLERSTNPTG